MIKAILLDIDGTLTNDQKEITPFTKDVLMRAQKRGIRLGIASARTSHGLKRFGDWLEFEKYHGIYVACNGAEITDASSGEMIYEKAIEPKLASEILEHLKKFQVIPLIAKGEHMYTNDVYAGKIHDANGNPVDIIRYESRSNNYLLCEEKDLAAFVDFPLTKILVSGEPDYLKSIGEELGKPFKDRAKCGFTAPVFYEYNAYGVDKAKAIASAFEKLGIKPEEMMAFGDQVNDIGMLEYVKYGIAMGNAVDACKASAFDVTDDNNHDGIAKAVLKYIPELAEGKL